MLLQLDWHYMQCNVLNARFLMELIDRALRGEFFPNLFGVGVGEGGGGVRGILREMLCHSIK